MMYFLRGMLIGLLFGLPIGAVGAMTVERTWNKGVKAGLFTGLGSSVADCLYASIGVFGLTIISDFLLRYQVIINILGGGLILFMGMRLLMKKEDTAPKKIEAAGVLKMFLSSFTVGITNPAAILTFLFAFSYFGISGNAGVIQGALLVSGVFIGTYIWWIALSLATNFIKNKSRKVNFQATNQIFGLLLMLFGSIIFIQTLLNF